MYNQPARMREYARENSVDPKQIHILRYAEWLKEKYPPDFEAFEKLAAYVFYAATDHEKTADNSIMVIHPYFERGDWVFDDASRNLVKEPFVCGMPEIIDAAVKDIPDARKGFRLYFSAQAFPGFSVKLNWLRADMDGNWYAVQGTEWTGWLCPALFKFFDDAPKTIYCAVAPQHEQAMVP